MFCGPVVLINGTEYPIQDNYTFNEVINAPGSGSFSTPGIIGTGLIRRARIEIINNLVTVFKGIAMKAAYQYTGTEATTTVSCSDYSFFLRRKVLTQRYDSDIASIMTFLAAEADFFPAVNIQSSLLGRPIIINCVERTLLDVLPDIVRQLQAYYKINIKTGALHIFDNTQAPYTTINAYSLCDANKQNLRYDIQAEELNRSVVFGINGDIGIDDGHPRTVVTRYDVLDHSVNKEFPLPEKTTRLLKFEMYPNTEDFILEVWPETVTMTPSVRAWDIEYTVTSMTEGSTITIEWEIVDSNWVGTDYYDSVELALADGKTGDPGVGNYAILTSGSGGQAVANQYRKGTFESFDGAIGINFSIPPGSSGPSASVVTEIIVPDPGDEERWSDGNFWILKKGDKIRAIYTKEDEEATDFEVTTLFFDGQQYWQDRVFSNGPESGGGGDGGGGGT